MATIDQLQDLEISRKGYLITPTTNLDFVGTTNNYKGVVGYNEDPNLITLTSTTVGGGFTDYLGRLMLWQLPIGTHYTSPLKTAEYVKIAQPTGVNMSGCWKKLSFDSGGSGYVEKDAYNAYTVLAATNDNDPQPITLNDNSLLGRISNVIQSISIDSDLTSVSSNNDTIPSAKAVVEYVNNTIAGALTFNGGYNVTTDTTDSDPTKKLQTEPYPVISKGDTYVVTTGGLFFDCPINNQQVTINGTVYTFKDVLTTPAVNTEILISSYTPINGKTIVINSVTYTFITSGTSTSDRILVNTNPVALGVGDMIIANKNSPTLLSHWTLVIKEIPNIVDASESSKGIIQIATNAEVTEGTDNTKAITPLRLKNRLDTLVTDSVKKYYALIENPESNGKPGVLTVFNIPKTTHLLGDTTDISITVRDISTGQIVEVETLVNSDYSVTLKFSIPPATNKYKVTLIG